MNNSFKYKHFSFIINCHLLDHLTDTKIQQRIPFKNAYFTIIIRDKLRTKDVIKHGKFFRATAVNREIWT